MGKFDTYKLPLKSLPIGTHTYEFLLDDVFFKNIDGEEFQRGKVNVTLILTRSEEKVFKLKFDLQGTIQIPCDRCLDNMDHEVVTEEKMTVRLGEEYSEEGDDTLIIPEQDSLLNIAWFLYEYIALTIPLKHVHPAGKCNKGMTSKLRKHSVRSNDEEDMDDIDTGLDFDDDSDTDDSATDPRWDALKDLKDNI